MFGQVALILNDLGWRPLPTAGKVPIRGMDGWNALCRASWDRNCLIAASIEFATCNCGLVVDDDHVVVDLDILDLELAQDVNNLAIEEFTATPLVRIGRAPRRALLYRSSGPVRGRKRHPIEVMSGGGQLERRHITMFEVISSGIGRGWSEARIIRLFERHFAGWNGVSEAAFRRVLDRYQSKEQ
jgi:hypothetical protein